MKLVMRIMILFIMCESIGVCVLWNLFSDCCVGVVWMMKCWCRLLIILFVLYSIVRLSFLWCVIEGFCEFCCFYVCVWCVKCFDDDL